MTAPAEQAAAWTLDQIGRIMITHRIEAALAAPAIGLAHGAVEGLLAGRTVDLGGEDQRTRAALFLNILTRLEVRHGHDGGAIRMALERPLAELGVRSMAELIRAGCSVELLRAIRIAAGSMAVARVKMWRVPDRYS